MSPKKKKKISKNYFQQTRETLKWQLKLERFEETWLK